MLACSLKGFGVRKGDLSRASKYWTPGLNLCKERLPDGLGRLAAAPDFSKLTRHFSTIKGAWPRIVEN